MGIRHDNRAIGIGLGTVLGTGLALALFYVYAAGTIEPNHPAVAATMDFVIGLAGQRGLMLSALVLIATLAMACAFLLLSARSARAGQENLQDALARAEAANDVQSRFLSQISEESRAPLDSVLATAEALIGTDPAQRRHAQSIMASGALLKAILTEAADLAKLHNGQLAIAPALVELPLLLKETAGLYFAAARDKGLELIVDVTPDLPRHVEIDPTRLRQILGGLIGNAMGCTSSGFIAVVALYERTGAAAGRMHISVSDTGAGLTAEQQSQLFVSSGLAICKKLCTAMGGDLGITSAAGVGSTASFWLPVVEQRSPVSSDASARRIGLVTKPKAPTKPAVAAVPDLADEAAPIEFGRDFPAPTTVAAAAVRPTEPAPPGRAAADAPAPPVALVDADARRKPAPPANLAAPAKSPAAATKPVAPAAEVAGAKVPLMDLAVLKQTRDLVRNFDTLLSFYRTDTRNYLTMLREQIEKDDLDEAVLPAHTIKSSSKIVGASGLEALAGLMETKLRSGEANSPVELRKLLQRMEDIFEHTLRQLAMLEAKGLLRPPVARAS